MKFCPRCNATFEDSVGFCPRDGEVLRESAADIVGRVLDGKYRVESFIAQGGMGAVYKARHILLGDEVVIKTLRAEMRSNSEWLRRFQREGRAARSFRHPNAVTVYDLSKAVEDGLVYMVMEYVEGRTLERELKQRGRFTPQQALEVLEPVADVLDAAHARGVVHRDLKLENVMLGTREDGRPFVKVLDLGIAKIVETAGAPSDESTSLTVAGQILGTPHYMSPEQWGELPRDGRAEIDGRADIYALGVMCFELIAGRKPFAGRTIAEIRREHVAAPAPSLLSFAPDVPEEFARTVMRAMSKERGERQATAGELTSELRAALARTEHPATTFDNPYATRVAAPAPPHAGIADSVETPQEHSSQTPAQKTRSRVPLVAGAALGVVLLACLGVWLARSQWEARRAEANTNVDEKGAPAASTAATDAQPAEAFSYWIEAFESARDETGVRVAETQPSLKSGQNFRFHFSFPERGYLYLVARAANGNALTTFLTAQGAGALKSNLVDAGTDFAFPLTEKLYLDQHPGTEEYTVIFSRTPLLEPAFLKGKFMHRLTPEEVKQLEDFRARHAGAASAGVKDEGGLGRISVTRAGGLPDRPLVYDLRIVHR